MKLKKILYFTICFILIIAFVFLITTAYFRLNILTSENNVSENTHTVIIDAGHGGEDGGAVNDNNVVEKDLNLQISVKLADMLTLFGYKTEQIRTEDKSVYTQGENVRQRKVSDMKNRLSVFNSNPENVVISIHQNKFEQSKYYGTQVFYSVNDADSVKLAESIRASVVKDLQPNNKRETKPATESIYVLNHAQYTAVLVECGFVSNAEELANLKDTAYQRKLAYGIFSGFLDYYKSAPG